MSIRGAPFWRARDQGFSNSQLKKDKFKTQTSFTAIYNDACM